MAKVGAVFCSGNDSDHFQTDIGGWVRHVRHRVPDKTEIHIRAFSVPSSKSLHMFPTTGLQSPIDVSIRERGKFVFFDKKNTKDYFLHSVDYVEVAEAGILFVVIEDEGCDEGCCIGPCHRYEICQWSELTSSVLTRAAGLEAVVVFVGTCHSGGASAEMAAAVCRSVVNQFLDEKESWANVALIDDLLREIQPATLTEVIRSDEFRVRAVRRLKTSILDDIAEGVAESEREEIGICRYAARCFCRSLDNALDELFPADVLLGLVGMSTMNPDDVSFGFARAFVEILETVIGDRATFLSTCHKVGDGWAKQMAPSIGLESLSNVQPLWKALISHIRERRDPQELANLLALRLKNSLSSSVFDGEEWHVDIGESGARLHSTCSCVLANAHLSGKLKTLIGAAIHEEIAVAIGEHIVSKIDVADAVGKFVDIAMFETKADSTFVVGTCPQDGLTFGTAPDGESSVGFATRFTLEETDGANCDRSLDVVFESVDRRLVEAHLPRLWIWRGRNARVIAASRVMGQSARQIWPVRPAGFQYPDERGARVMWPRGARRPCGDRVPVTLEELTTISRELELKACHADKLKRTVRRDLHQKLGCELIGNLSDNTCRYVPVSLIDRTFTIGEKVLRIGGTFEGAQELLKDVVKRLQQPGEIGVPGKAKITPTTTVVVTGGEQITVDSIVISLASSQGRLEIARRYSLIGPDTPTLKCVSREDFAARVKSGRVLGSCGLSLEELTRVRCNGKIPILGLEVSHLIAFTKWEKAHESIFVFLLDDSDTPLEEVRQSFATTTCVDGKQIEVVKTFDYQSVEGALSAALIVA
jgi:hypothetical protein